MADSAFARKTLPQLIAQVKSDINARFQADDVLRRSDAEVYGRALAASVHSLYGFIDYLARNLLPDLADEEWLTRHASIRQCPRKAAQAASGYARFDGAADGISISAGALFQGPDGQEYLATADAVAGAGLLRVPVVCQEAGTVGNLDDGVELQLVNPVSGLSSLAVADTLGAGADLESLEDWRARVLATYAEPPQGGTDADYKRWALEVPGVDRAWVLPALAGAGTVTVAIATSDLVDPTPSTPLLSAVFTAIDAARPVAGKGLFVVSPSLVPFSPSIRLSPDSADLRTAVAVSLREFFYREGELGGMTLSLSRVSEAISLTPGEFSHQLVAPTTDPIYAALELPVLGIITWLS
ncbi:MAG: baseplate J/gp47 family protein [Pseudomonadota bacterium]